MELKTNIGCYLLKHNGVVVYVGQSVNLLARLGTHAKDKKKHFDEYEFIFCEKEKLSSLESKLIQEYDPIYNVMKNDIEFVDVEALIQRLRYFHTGRYKAPSDIKKIIKQLDLKFEVRNFKAVLLKSDVIKIENLLREYIENGKIKEEL